VSKVNTSDTARAAGTVVGLFHDNTQAERAIRDLKAAGFADRQIGVLMQDQNQQRELAENTGTKAEEGAATGAVSGGVLGGIVGLLAGIGALAIPGIGPIIAGGALASTLAGAGIGAAAGGLVGALIGMGIPEEDARYYEGGLKEGGILVTVEAGANAERARRVLLEAGAQFGPATVNTFDADDRQRLQLREEEVRTSKERVQTGEVTLRKDVITEEKTIQVPVTREEVVIERHAVSGEAAGQAGNIREGEEIRIPLSEEQVHVEKRPVVKEEISVGKRQVQDTATVRTNVRREEARVEQTGESRPRSSWKGKERRVRYDNSYSGPERRLATV
jgi:uncharacterized protein (TIGR02271 family)